MIEKFTSVTILIILLTISFIPISHSKELIDTLTPPWGDYETCPTEYFELPDSQKDIYYDNGYQTGDEYKEEIVIGAIAAARCGVEITQKCWHTTTWTTTHEDNFQFAFDYDVSGWVELTGASDPRWPPTGFNTGWCNITVFVQIIDDETGSYWANYWRCVAAKSDIIIPFTHQIDESVEYNTRKMHMTEGRELTIKFGLIVKTTLAAFGLATESCMGDIVGNMNYINIYSDYDPSKPVLCTDPDDLNCDFGEQYKGPRVWSFNVYNGGGGDLDTYTISEDSNWMLITPNIFGFDHYTHYLIIDTSNLDYGHHETSFTIQSDYGEKTGTIEVDVVNAPPYLPGNPTPRNGACDQNLDGSKKLDFSWECGDVDSDDIVYSLYLGKDPENLAFKGFSFKKEFKRTLDYGAKYYWQIVAKDVIIEDGEIVEVLHETEGPIWNFSTEALPITVDAGGPYSGKPNEDIVFTASANGGVKPYSFAWSFDGDNSDYEVEGNGVTHSWNSEGTYYYPEVKVVDSQGESDTDTCTVNIDKSKVKSKEYESNWLFLTFLEKIIEKYTNTFFKK